MSGTIPRIDYGSAIESNWFKNCTPNDYDIIYPEGKKPKFTKMEVYLYYKRDKVNCRSIFVDAKTLPVELFSKLAAYCDNENKLSPWGHYVLRMSHSFWDVGWEKNTRKIIRYQTEHGFSSPSCDLFSSLVNYWEHYHGSKNHIKLKKPNEEFFKDGVKKRVIDHDELHHLVKYHKNAWHYDLKTDKTSAYIPKSSFDCLKLAEQFEVCREEIYVIALERFLIPSNFTDDPLKSYRKALKKLVTSMSKGWFPLFIMSNLADLKNPCPKYKENIEIVKQHLERKNYGTA